MVDVRGAVNYLSGQSEGFVKYTQQRERSTLQHDSHEVTMLDMRGMSPPPALDREGFMLAHLPLDPDLPQDVDAIAAVYHPLLIDWITQLTGAERVVPRRPILRWSRNMPRDTYATGPADYVHGDFATEVFHNMARELLAGDPDAERLLAGRYAVVQTWRVLTPPPQDYPLALIDRRTVNPDELVVMSSVIGEPGKEQAYTSFSLKYAPHHRWAYCSDMTTDDMLVFIGSESDNPMPGILHSSFDNGGNVENWVPRVSCEVRAFAFWG